HVTGVQTCALPISWWRRRLRPGPIGSLRMTVPCGSRNRTTLASAPFRSRVSTTGAGSEVGDGCSPVPATLHPPFGRTVLPGTSFLPRSWLIRYCRHPPVCARRSPAPARRPAASAPGAEEALRARSRCPADAVTAVPLGAVQGAVGELHQAVLTLTRQGYGRGDADADRDRRRHRVGGAPAPVRHGRPDALGRRRRATQVRPGHQHRELLAPVPGGEVPAAHGGPQRRRHVLQATVAG